MKRRTLHKRPSLNRKLISFAVASCFAAEFAYANPTGPSVAAGSASFSTVGSALTVTNSPNAIINWRGFSIGAGEATRFQQQSASSAVLNRVVGQDPSAILGTLWSNGKVFLINPNGILFGQGSRVDVGGLVASTLNITDGDFLGGRLNFQAGSVANSIVNQGELRSATGGHIYLVAPDVTNSGLISSPKGEVVLAAGKTVSLVDIGTPNLKVEVSASESEARNLGQIVADSGRIGVYAGLINQQGTVRADSVTRDATGKIVFRASDTATLGPESVISASGAGGGEIYVLARNAVKVAGRLDASAPNGGDGGFIETSAAHVHVDPAAVITTAAPYGKSGTWLVDPNDYTIASSGGDITGATLSSKPWHHQRNHHLRSGSVVRFRQYQCQRHRIVVEPEQPDAAGS
jgi:filamentous hemagglutinin family protein